MAGSLTKLQVRVMEVQQKTHENNLLQHFFCFNDLNNIDVEAATSLKGRMYKSALVSSKKHFKVLTITMTEMFLKCELLLEADSVEMDNYQDFCRYFINIML